MSGRVEPILALMDPAARAIHDTSGFATPAVPGSVLAKIQALGFTRGRNLSIHEVRARLDEMIRERNARG